jgi:serine/tyrosine/threonine adenylyltransferase
VTDRFEVCDLDELPFVERFTALVPGDPDTSNTRRQVHGAGWSAVRPTSVSAPRTLAVSPEVATLLGLSAEVTASDDFAQVFAGARVPRGAVPFAMCYGGHQFGSWAGQLGDGRALALGEVQDVHGGYQTLQLKGAGPTPYSRGADGRAVLRSSLREFLCSEAMYHLGVPTTRALSLVATGDAVVRDMLYDGNPQAEPGAVVCRVAPSFVRFGSFQLPASRGDVELLRTLTRAVMALDFPHLANDASLTEDEQVAAMFHEVCQRTATLMVHWMRVGFVHGVMNTDNLSIVGLTIDYGPYGWLEDFDPTWTPNTTDAAGRRYRYGAQPQVAHWNLLQLANALVVLTQHGEPLQQALDGFATAYGQQFEAMMAARLGWGELQPGDDEAFADLFTALQLTETDTPLFFRSLADVPIDHEVSDEALLGPLSDVWYRPDDLTADIAATWLHWLRRWGERCRRSGLEPDRRHEVMNGLNPRYVLRNWLAQEAIDAAAAGDTAPLHDLWEVLRHPYRDQPGAERFATRRPEWARHRVGCSMLSCSS